MLCGQKKGLCAFKFLFFIEVPCEPYKKLPFLSNKPCSQGSTACNFEMVSEKGRKKTPKRQPCEWRAFTERDKFGSNCSQPVFFFKSRSDLVLSFCQAEGNWVGSVTKCGHQSLNWPEREIPWVSDLCFLIPWKGQNSFSTATVMSRRGDTSCGMCICIKR